METEGPSQRCILTSGNEIQCDKVGDNRLVVPVYQVGDGLRMRHQSCQNETCETAMLAKQGGVYARNPTSIMPYFMFSSMTVISPKSRIQSRPSGVRIRLPGCTPVMHAV